MLPGLVIMDQLMVCKTLPGIVAGRLLAYLTDCFAVALTRVDALLHYQVLEGMFDELFAWGHKYL